ncbi:hypothetical protein ABPG72_012406 [Tetrahymena utriculariae]
MIYSKLDLFSSQFSFNVSSNYSKKGTLIGTLLTFLVVIPTLTYFIYIMKQYFMNEIQPNYRSQSFISDDYSNITLQNDLIAFKFDFDANSNPNVNLDQKNKTYFVFMAKFYQRDDEGSNTIQLDIINCINPNLLGFMCLDFSKISNYSLSMKTQNNLLSQIQIFTYGCLDLDSYKTFIPNNCANQTEIDSLINGVNSGLKLKLFTSQYNISSRQIQSQYRNAIVYTVAGQQILTQIKTQLQITSVKQGALIQSEQVFQSPIQYYQQDQNLDRQYAFQAIGIGSYSCVFIYPDEIVQYIEIQYQTLPQVFSFVSSIFTCLMFLGILGRRVSQSSIRKDLFISFLKSMFQDKYLQILKDNGLYKDQLSDQDSNLFLQDQHKDRDNPKQIEDKSVFIDQSKDEDERSFSNIIPIFKNKVKLQLDSQQILNSNKKDDLNQSNQKMQSFLMQSAFIQQNQHGIIPECQKDDFLVAKQETSQVKQEITSNQKLNLSIQNITKSQISYNYQSKNNIKEAIIFANNKQKQSLQSKFEKKNQNQKIESQISDSNQQQLQQQQPNFNNQVQKFLTIQNSSLSNKIQKLIFRFTLCKKKKIQKITGLNEDQLSQIDYQINKNLDIQKFLKDLMTLKKAIMILLSQDQLAALQLIGCSQNILDLNFKELKTKQKQLDNNLSHYERQFIISQSQLLQQQQIQSFLQRCSNNIQDLSDIDQRILSSLNQSKPK